MIRLILAALVCSAALAAEPSFYLDLAGTWRYSSGDDVRFSRADFDDHLWETRQIPMPPTTARRAGRDLSSVRFWLRRQVDLPSGSQAKPLALTIGGVSEIYEVYVNGLRIGGSGPFEIDAARMAQARTFYLPPDLPTPLVIAVRAWRPALVGISTYWLPDSGPWLLAEAAVAPRDPARLVLLSNQRERLSNFLLGILLALQAAVVAFIWLKERHRRELAWLALFLLSASLGRLDSYLVFSYAASPWGPVGGTVKFTLQHGPLPMALLAQFAATRFAIRWLPFAAWPIAVAGGLAFALHAHATQELSNWGAHAMHALYGVTLAGMALAWRRTEAAGRVIMAGIVVLEYALVSGFGRLDWLGIPAWSGWPLRGAPYLTTLFVFSLLYSIYLVRLLLHHNQEKQRLTVEMQAARTVQQLMLPGARLETAEFRSEVTYLPALEVGGDFYWTQVDATSGALILVVGDVSGKGLKAAMLVSVAIGILRATKSSSPGLILAALNEGLVGHCGGGFVTCCCARFGAKVVVANAGHPSPYVDGAEAACEAGLPLGVLSGVEYEETVVPGERFTFVSDGVVEAENSVGELFGFERTRAISGQSAGEIAAAAQAWGQNDDITVVTVRRSA